MGRNADVRELRYADSDIANQFIRVPKLGCIFLPPMGQVLALLNVSDCLG
jgi:hypothetical protein